MGYGGEKANSLQKPFISVSDDDDQLSISCEIPLSVRADFICSLYTENDALLYQRDSQWSQSGNNLCMFYVSRSELFTRSVNSRRLICVYSLKTEPEIRSPHSDTYTIRESPTVKVSPDVIRESSSVKISCETPADVRVNQCYFITNREEKNLKVSSSCELELTGAEVLRWAGVKSPESIYINCYYTIHEGGINKPSSDSPPATVTVLDALPKPFISVSDDQLSISCEIPLSVRADFICSLYTENDALLYQRDSQWSQSGNNLCMFYVSRSELFTRSVNSRQLICVYSLKTEPEIRSPGSDTYTIRDLLQAKLRASTSVILETDTVELSCENTEDLKMEKCYFSINGEGSNSKVSSSCQLSLICSADVLTELNYTSCQLETTSILTSSVCPSKHG
ncbi:uncharacterized protein LOC107751229 [Sinocyclocheilus rhinocerous]|uniref:uncharacterized protein LOC107751229 n=1 Tax=Sinocyclocheilus rhinocerous TaxID=307959 RepID=UPI0007B9A26D|nr:PREDICTED: uncharacterized protein LOC107751229 [Sinocyclocheilus rhinocerous]